MSNEGWTITEAAEALGVSEKTIRRYIKNGKLSAKKVEGKGGFVYRVDNLSVLPAYEGRQNRPVEDILLAIIREKERQIAALQEERIRLVSQLGQIQSQNHYLKQQMDLLAKGLETQGNIKPKGSSFWVKLLGR